MILQCLWGSLKIKLWISAFQLISMLLERFCYGGRWRMPYRRYWTTTPFSLLFSKRWGPDQRIVISQSAWPFAENFTFRKSREWKTVAFKPTTDPAGNEHLEDIIFQSFSSTSKFFSDPPLLLLDPVTKEAQTWQCHVGPGAAAAAWGRGVEGRGPTKTWPWMDLPPRGIFHARACTACSSARISGYA